MPLSHQVHFLSYHCFNNDKVSTCYIMHYLELTCKRCSVLEHLTEEAGEIIVH